MLEPSRALAEQLELMRSKILLEELQSVKAEDAKKFAKILELIMVVENSVQIHLSDKERRQLGIELLRSGESMDSIFQMAENVKRSTDRYGRMDFSLWINSARVFTGSDITAELNRIQAIRVEQLKKLNYTEDQIEEAGLRAIQDVNRRRLQVELDRRNGELVKRVKAAEKFIRTSSDAVKMDMVEIAIAKELITKDEPFPKDVVPYFASKMLKEIESYMRRMKA